MVGPKVSSQFVAYLCVLCGLVVDLFHEYMTTKFTEKTEVALRNQITTLPDLHPN